MGNFPNNPLCQFNEGNDQMNGLEEDQPVRRAVHRCSPKPVGHLPYHNIYCPICMDTVSQWEKNFTFSILFTCPLLFMVSQFRSTPWPKVYQLP